MIFSPLASVSNKVRKYYVRELKTRLAFDMDNKPMNLEFRLLLGMGMTKTLGFDF